MALEIRLQTLKCYHDHRYIVQRLFVESQLHDVLHRLPAELMQSVETALIPPEGVPDHLDHISIIQLVVNTVAYVIKGTTSEDYEIVLLSHADVHELGLADDGAGVATELGQLRLDVAESTGH